MKPILIIAVMLLLGGCATSEYQAYKSADRRAQENDKLIERQRHCARYGEVVVESGDEFWCQSQMSRIGRADHGARHNRPKHH